MERPKLNIGILTSSRADYGIYLPVLNAMKKDSELTISIIAFGTHLKEEFGYTLNAILDDGFEVPYQVDTMLPGDQPVDISSSFGNTSSLFARFWEDYSKQFDIVFCLGDRYEMAAAVTAGIPFGMKFAHIHAGETSEGAIDNIYRDQISLASKIHFVSLPQFKTRIENLIQKKDTAFVVGAISLENIKNTPLLSIEEFYKKWNIDLKLPTILLTMHPETVHFEMNHHYCNEIEKSVNYLSKKYQLVVSMPNSDTLGSIYRTTFEKLAKSSNSIILIENFGSQSYFTAMNHSKLLIGNTSSGILEAASFNKYVLNLGDRQKNRACGENVIHLPIKFEQIIETTEMYINRQYLKKNIYSQQNGVNTLIDQLKIELNEL